jgi:carbamoyltransferase
MTFILGINSFHGDSSACILRSNQLIAAAEEERFRRIKHWSGFPSEAIRYCLQEAGIQISEVEHIAINTNPKSNFVKKIIYTLKNTPSLKIILQSIKNAKKRSSIKNEFKKFFPTSFFYGNIHLVEHHLAHIASAYLVSPFKNSVVISVDGFGDFSSGAWGFARESEIKIEGRVFFPHSLGIFYQALTQFLGFPNYGDEYKVMGLAPYGKPIFIDKMRQIVKIKKDGSYSLNLDLFQHHKKKNSYISEQGEPIIEKIFNSNLEEFIGVSPRNKSEILKQVHYDLASSAQAIYEEAFFNLLNATYAKYKIDNLILAGGCAMNSVANGKIYRQSSYKNVYIQSAAGDAGGAIGSAYITARNLGFLKERFIMKHAYWGPAFNDNYQEALLTKNKIKIDKLNCIFEKITNEDELCLITAEAINQGQVVGWFQGRMEWGPRALGNRSILADPRRDNMKEILNLKIKRRESFRPFAPSILREHVFEWFEEDDDVPFMSQVFQIKENKRKFIPAVTHVDGSGRLQTVHFDTNPRYYKLINEFKKKTGVPIILNTSFNENEPIVCRPEEALDTFLRTKMDMLVLDDWVIKRK